MSSGTILWEKSPDGKTYEFKYEELWNDAKEIYIILKQIKNNKK